MSPDASGPDRADGRADISSLRLHAAACCERVLLATVPQVTRDEFVLSRAPRDFRCDVGRPRAAFTVVICDVLLVCGSCYGGDWIRVKL